MGIPTTAEYLERIMAGKPNEPRTYRYDNDLVAALNITAYTLSKYKHGHNMSVTVAIKIAEILRIHPMETIAATMERQSEKAEDKALWRFYYEKYRTTTETEHP